jgi:DnaJ domain
MSITKLPKAKTPTGRAVQRAVRGIRPRTPVGKIAVALTAELGGAIGDGAHRVFAPASGSQKAAEAEAAARMYGGRLREERARQYAAEALREQWEAGRRAEEAYRRARAESGRGEERGEEHGGRTEDDVRSRTKAQTGARQERTYRYGGKTVADYYEVMEVSPKARRSVIEKAYRALMREDHPDQGGDVQKAQLINEAYQVLHDPEARRKYDQQNGFC